MQFSFLLCRQVSGLCPHRFGVFGFLKECPTLAQQMPRAEMCRGHGTLLQDDEEEGTLVATVSGAIQRVNRLVSVKAFTGRCVVLSRATTRGVTLRPATTEHGPRQS